MASDTASTLRAKLSNLESKLETETLERRKAEQRLVDESKAAALAMAKSVEAANAVVEMQNGSRGRMRELELEAKRAREDREDQQKAAEVARQVWFGLGWVGLGGGIWFWVWLCISGVNFFLCFSVCTFLFLVCISVVRQVRFGLVWVGWCHWFWFCLCVSGVNFFLCI